MVIRSQAYNMVFLLHIGHIGLKCPSLAYKVLIGLKMTNYYQNHPFLISFCFTLKAYFAMKSHFFSKENEVINPKKGLEIE